MILRKSSLKYKLLQVLAFVGDAGLELLMNEVLVTGKVRMQGRKLYSSRHFERILKELTTTGFISRVEKNGKSYLKLTTQGDTKISRHIPLASLQKQKWDGYFRCLSYDFPQKQKYKRDRLREQIKEWGMGNLQYSLYITAHPIGEIIEEFITAQKLEEYAYLLVTRRKLTIEEGRKIAKKVWKLEDLDNEYFDFNKKWQEKIFDKSIKESDIEKLRFEYYSLIEKDPHLPFNLLEDDWLAKEAKETYLAVEEAIKS
jgi:phenylacetic acid degradation operon negative regulatory protein